MFDFLKNALTGAASAVAYAINTTRKAINKTVHFALDLLPNPVKDVVLFAIDVTFAVAFISALSLTSGLTMFGTCFILTVAYDLVGVHGFIGAEYTLSQFVVVTVFTSILAPVVAVTDVIE